MKKEGVDYPVDKGQNAKKFLTELEEHEKDNASAREHLGGVLKKLSAGKYSAEFPGGKSVAIKNELGEIIFFTYDPKRDLLPWIDGLRANANRNFDTGNVIEEKDALGDFLRNLK